MSTQWIKPRIKPILLGIFMPALILGCSTQTPSDTEVTSEDSPETGTEQTTNPESSETADAEGTLTLVANGEDFVRQGFVTKDGWEISFDHVYANLADVTAYQTDPPYDPDKETDLKSVEEVALVEDTETVDLAAGDETAAPIAVTETKAPTGMYNALAWSVVPADSGEAAGSAIKLVGQASKDGETIDFTLNLDQPLTYTCGEFVGDQRKGIVQGEDSAEVEATFHFDHIFGDGDAPADDEINTGAVGFDPMAALAEGDTLETDLATLEAELDSETYAKLQEAIVGLGHVGEGHCREMGTTS
ncbi:hypothetical protein PN462_13660 [Spirulina sp. CS-785/01]|uniref:hypothetical protein n=1 Tax=Spirulina sp. CS-785/01 TaxID=3021716 RepID=UPI00232CC36E|nr:hypothetical protein [Spirulina sp. CS-785/01]MDB9314153.1 hypothetical protein [Spirulina sp. CS-785/01]